MADGLTLSGLGLRAGVCEGVVDGPAGAAPALRATHLDRTLDGLTLTEADGHPGRWKLRLPLPADLLSDGVQTVLVADAQGTVLGSLAIAAGAPLEQDLRAEIDLLRAELDLLKRAFRRHCAESS